jgi:hypothetical protein
MYVCMYAPHYQKETMPMCTRFCAFIENKKSDDEKGQKHSEWHEGKRISTFTKATNMQPTDC